jgi:uncharacterized protein DUF5648
MKGRVIRERNLTTAAALKTARRLLCGVLTIGLVLIAAPLQSAPRVVVGLTEESQISFATPPPMLQWAATVDPATLSTVATLSPSGAYTVAADLHGHRAYLSSGGGITVIDASLNRIEAAIRLDPYPPIAPITLLVSDPVRARLYATANFGQPQIQVFDTNALAFVQPIALPANLPIAGVSSIVVAPDGTRLYALVANVLLTLGLPDGQVVQSATLDSTPTALALNQDRNELYVTDGSRVFVLAADSLVIQRSLAGFSGIESITVRRADGALLVESDVVDDPDTAFSETRVDAVDVVTGAVLATTSLTANIIGLVMSIDGKQAYRFQRGNLAPGGGPYSDTSSRLVVMDTMSLRYTGSMSLDTRAPDDPSRQGSAIVSLGAASVPLVTLAVEYFDAALGHYFTTSIPAEIAALDGGMFPGWQRTGETLPVYAQRADGPDGTTPVCRFYGLPEKGLDSHFYSASPAECAAVQQKWGDFWLLESSDVFDVYPADATTGTCPFETTPVYRVYNNRPDANHRYTTSLSVRDSMAQAGWIPEGYGPNAVAFCVPR